MREDPPCASGKGEIADKRLGRLKKALMLKESWSCAAGDNLATPVTWALADPVDVQIRAGTIKRAIDRLAFLMA
jgi:hypothetical protein